MALELNINPYYDDFDENKNYHKILFKPGSAVQARELTQIQTIIQDQIEKFGKFVLADGSRVSGARVFTDNNVRVVQLVQTENIDLSDILDFNGLYVVAATSKLMGAIVDVDYTNLQLTIKPFNVAGLNNFLSGETLNIFNSKDTAYYYTLNNQIVPNYTVTVATDTTFSVTNASSSKYSLELTVNTLTLQVGDVLSYSTFDKTYTIVEIVDGTTCVVDKAFDSTFTNITLTVTRYASRKSLQVSIDEGIFFTNGYFAKNLAQSIVPDIKTEFPSAVIGFHVNETIHDYIDDSSLLDPALGSSNYSAPGADRYVLELELVSKPLVGDSLSNLTTTKFIELIRIKRGVIIKSNLNPTLGELEKTLARQMYDHAGNFFVKPFTISFSEAQLLNSQNTLPIEISSGKAYVFGHEFEVQYPFAMSLDKSRDTDIVSNYDLTTYYGNSIRIKDLFGSLSFQSSPTIELHSNSVNQSFSSKIGTAQARNFKYNTTNDYNLYLYDIKLNKADDIGNVKSAVITTSANTYSAYTFKANTIQTSNVTILTDSTFQSLVFNLPHNNIKTISNVDFESNLIGTYTFAANTTSVFSGSLTTQILGGTGVISSAIKKQYFYVTAKQTNGSYTAGNAIDTDDLIINISQTGSEYVASLTTTNGKVYNGTADIWYTVQYTNAQPKLKTKVENQIACVTVTNYKNPVSLGIADIYSVKGIYKLNSNSSMYFGSWNSANTYYIGSYVTANNSIYYATNGSTNQSPATSNSWVKLTPSIVDYTLNTGQNSSYYDHGTFTVNSNTNVGTYVIIFDYFTHGSGGYLSQASYPVSVGYTDLPSFIDNTGKIIELRDAIDFRPRRQNFSSSLTFDSFNIPATTFSGFMLSYNYYLSRIDKFILTDNKDFKIIKGVSKYTNIAPPATPQNSMLLATIHYNAYGFSKNDIKIVYENHRRYTMDDIGVLDKRINRVEYYTSLSLAESEAINKSTSDSLLKSRLRNGFLVDSFSSLVVADLSNVEYNCSIDLQGEICRPSIQSNIIKPRYHISENDYGQYVSNGLLHFPYSASSTDSILASNKKATGTINCNPFDVMSFAGSLSISPQVDSWFEVNELPDINTVSDDLVALNTALGNPALVYDSWNLYNSQNNIQQDNSSQTAVVKSGDYAYNIGVGVTKQSKVVEDIRRNVIAYARATPIQLRADGLSPFTKMYVFVNGHMLNGYIQYGKNSTGQITGIKLENSGTKYLSSNTVISIVSGTNATANATANVTSNGQIIDIELLKLGTNYADISNTKVFITGMGTGATANVSLSTRNGNDLITDSAGTLECTLYLPCNDDVKFRTGELLISISDDPIEPKRGSSLAEAIFTSTGDLKIIQETITSIRRPYIKKDYVPTYTQSTYVAQSTYVPTYTQSTSISDVDDKTPEGGGLPPTTSDPKDPITPTIYTQDIVTSLNSFTSYEWSLNTNRNVAGDYTSSISASRSAPGGYFNRSLSPKVTVNPTGSVDLSFIVADIGGGASGGKTSFTIPASMIPGRNFDLSSLQVDYDRNGYGGSNYKATNLSLFGYVYNPSTDSYTVTVKQNENNGNDVEGFTGHIRFNTAIDPNNPINYTINQVQYTGTNGVKDLNSKTILQSGMSISSLPSDVKENILKVTASGGTSTAESMTVTGTTVTTQTSTTPFVNTNTNTVTAALSDQPLSSAASNLTNLSQQPNKSSTSTLGTSVPVATVSTTPKLVTAATYNNAAISAIATSKQLQAAVTATNKVENNLNSKVTKTQPAAGTITAISTFQSTASTATTPKAINSAAKTAVAAVKADTSLTKAEKKQLITAVNKQAAAEKKENAKEAAAQKAQSKLASVAIKPKK